MADSDLERRLRRYGAELDAAIEADTGPAVPPVADVALRASARGARRTRTRVVAGLAAAAVIAAVVVVVLRPDHQPTRVASTQRPGLHVVLGDDGIWPASTDARGTGTTPSEAALSFLAELGLTRATIANDVPVGSSSPVFLTAHVGSLAVAMLLSPTQGRWEIQQVGGGLGLRNDPHELLSDAPEGNHADVAWRDGAGMHYLSAPVGHDGAISVDRDLSGAVSAVAVTYAASGEVTRVLGGYYGHAPTTTIPVTPARACTSSDLSIQSASGLPPAPGPALFVRVFNTSGTPCTFGGVLGVAFRTDGQWIDFKVEPATGSTTNGPAWTGTFTPRLVAVTTITGTSAGGGGTRYDGLRLILPSGEVVEYLGVDITLATPQVRVTPIEADSQDG